MHRAFDNASRKPVQVRCSIFSVWFFDFYKWAKISVSAIFSPLLLWKRQTDRRRPLLLLRTLLVRTTLLLLLLLLLLSTSTTTATTIATTPPTSTTTTTAIITNYSTATSTDAEKKTAINTTWTSTSAHFSIHRRCSFYMQSRRYIHACMCKRVLQWRKVFDTIITKIGRRRRVCLFIFYKYVCMFAYMK